jgi:hypothetical protein
LAYFFQISKKPPNQQQWSVILFATQAEVLRPVFIMESSLLLSPASARKQQTKIVSLFTKLMTPTKKEEDQTRVEVQQLGEEVYVLTNDI